MVLLKTFTLQIVSFFQTGLIFSYTYQFHIFVLFLGSFCENMHSFVLSFAYLQKEGIKPVLHFYLS